MSRYALKHWSIRLARVAYRLERATATAIESVMIEDQASWHYEDRALKWTDELAAWSQGFKSGWIAAGSDGHPWFELAASGAAGVVAQPDQPRA